jgi:hypothetical protein
LDDERPGDFADDTFFFFSADAEGGGASPGFQNVDLSILVPSIT